MSSASNANPNTAIGIGTGTATAAAPVSSSSLPSASPSSAVSSLFSHPSSSAIYSAGPAVYSQFSSLGKPAALSSLAPSAAPSTASASGSASSGLSHSHSQSASLGLTPSQSQYLLQQQQLLLAQQLRGGAQSYYPAFQSYYSQNPSQLSLQALNPYYSSLLQHAQAQGFNQGYSQLQLQALQQQQQLIAQAHAQAQAQAQVQAHAHAAQLSQFGQPASQSAFQLTASSADQPKSEPAPASSASVDPSKQSDYNQAFAAAAAAILGTPIQNLPSSAVNNAQLLLQMIQQQPTAQSAPQPQAAPSTAAAEPVIPASSSPPAPASDISSVSSGVEKLSVSSSQRMPGQKPPQVRKKQETEKKEEKQKQKQKEIEIEIEKEKEKELQKAAELEEAKKAPPSSYADALLRAAAGKSGAAPSALGQVQAAAFPASESRPDPRVRSARDRSSASASVSAPLNVKSSAAFPPLGSDAKEIERAELSEKGREKRESAQKAINEMTNKGQSRPNSAAQIQPHKVDNRPKSAHSAVSAIHSSAVRASQPGQGNQHQNANRRGRLGPNENAAEYSRDSKQSHSGAGAEQQKEKEKKASAHSSAVDEKGLSAVRVPAADHARVLGYSVNQSPVAFVASAGSRFFIVKAASDRQMIAALKLQAWGFETKFKCAALESAVKAASEASASVFIFFTIRSSQEFCAVARVRSGPGPESAARNFAVTASWHSVLPVEFLIVKNLGRTASKQVRIQTGEDTRPLTSCKDGQEITADQGKALMALFDAVQPADSLIDKISAFDSEKQIQNESASAGQHQQHHAHKEQKKKQQKKESETKDATEQAEGQKQKKHKQPKQPKAKPAVAESALNEVANAASSAADSVNGDSAAAGAARGRGQRGQNRKPRTDKPESGSEPSAIQANANESAVTAASHSNSTNSSRGGRPRGRGNWQKKEQPSAEASSAAAPAHAAEPTASP